MLRTRRAGDRPVQGILLLCLAVACFAGMSGLVKHVSRHVPMPEVAWGRYFFHMLLMMALFAPRLPTLLHSRRKPVQVVRGLLVLGATLCSFTAVRYLPLADITALAFVGPLMVTGFAALFLGEPVGARRWAAVAVGFAGVLVIIRPGFQTLHWAMLMPLAMALCYAVYQVLTRTARDAAPPVNALFYTAVVGAAGASLVAPFGWVWPTAAEWALLVAIAFLGGFGHLLMILAYERAPASTLAPFLYTELLWVGTVAFLAFDEVPDRWTLAGAAVIVGSGLYVLHRERVRARASRRAGAAVTQGG